MRRAGFAVVAALAWAGAQAQGTTDFGLPPPSGSQYPVLPPPSGSQNPVLPPPTGQRYLPGVGGRFGDSDRRMIGPPRAPGDDRGLGGALSPQTRSFGGAAADRLDQIAPAFRRCWAPPAMTAPQEGAMASVRFSLRRDGSLFGQPRAIWGAGRFDPAFQGRFTASAIAAIRDCTPLRLSPRLGQSIAGRPFTIRFHGRAPSNERPI